MRVQELPELRQQIDTVPLGLDVVLRFIAPTGTLAGASGASQPSFAIEFRVRVP